MGVFVHLIAIDMKLKFLRGHQMFKKLAYKKVSLMLLRKQKLCNVKAFILNG